MAYHDNQLGELQITLQEVIDMIDSLIEEEMIGDDGRQKKIIRDDKRQKKIIEDNGRQKKMMKDDD